MAEEEETQLRDSTDVWNYVILALAGLGGLFSIAQAQKDGKQSAIGLVVEIFTGILTAWVMYNNRRMNFSDKMATVLPELGTIFTSGLILHGLLRNRK